MESGVVEILKRPEVIWFFIGLVLMLSEFVIPGLIILFFGLGCWVASAVLLIFSEISLTVQLMIFLGSSILLLVLLRNKAKDWIGNEKVNRGNDELLDEFIGRKGVADTPIKRGGFGKIIFKGTTWEAESDYDIERGDTVVITGKESIKLFVKPLNIP